MTQSGTGEANLAFATSLVDEWVRAGVTDAVVSPGSRSAPLALALARDDTVRVHVHLDERSAAFLALGLAKATGRPSVVACTSGTAAANFHPAVLEAFHARVPLIVCTADRPPELREVGAGQTIDQSHLFGGAVRWFFEPEAPAGVEAASSTWRALAARAAIEAFGPPPGPVHLNLPLREPLVPSGPPDPAEATATAAAPRPRRPWVRVRRPAPSPDRDMVQALARAIGGRRALLVAGFGADGDGRPLAEVAAALGLPLFADPLSGARQGEVVISTYDALCRSEMVRRELMPDVVVRLGAPVTSRQAAAWLAKAPNLLIDPHRSWLDPARSAEDVFEADPLALLHGVAELLGEAGDRGWLGTWLSVERAARTAIDRTIDSWAEPFDGRVTRDVMAALPNGSVLTVASSMAVRDLETFAAPRRGVRVLANRGVNGIDGFVSTTVGVALARQGEPTVALLGDLAFLHDANGLLGAVARGAEATFVVLDNGGGGIFSFLPQADLPEHFEELFATPQDVDVFGLAELHGAVTTELASAEEVPLAVSAAVAKGGVQVLRARSDRAVNVRRHRAVADAAVDAAVLALRTGATSPSGP